jgi:hypothetical protein
LMTHTMYELLWVAREPNETEWGGIYMLKVQI